MVMEDLTSLQNTLNDNITKGVTTGIQDQLEKLIAFIVVPSIILTVVIIVLYVLHTLRRRKIENAILEIRDSLREIKLAQVAPAKAVTQPSESTPPLAS